MINPMEEKSKYDARMITEAAFSPGLSFLSIFGEVRKPENHYLEIENKDTGRTKRIKIGRTDYFLRSDPLNKGDFDPISHYSGIVLSDLKFTEEGLEAKASMKNGRYDCRSVLDSQLNLDSNRVLLSRHQLPN